MPRYFFDVENGTHVSDPIGQEFIDDLTARKQAARVAKELAATRKRLDSYRLVVRNARSERIYEIPLRQVSH